MPRRFFLVLLAAALAACAPAGAGTGAAVPNRDVVEANELITTGAADLYSALRQVRPEFFVARGVSSIRLNAPDLPVVYLNGVELGDLESLRSISTLNVREVRRLSPQEAAARTGTNTPGGALLVTTKKTG